MSRILRPSERIVKSFIRKYHKLGESKEKASPLKLLFTQWCPQNDNLNYVLLKAKVLNNNLGTRISDIQAVAKRIHELKIDEDLNSGKGELVNEIALSEIGGKTINNYSFATKYYSFHKPRIYPIYDQFAGKMLWHFRNVDQFAEFERKELKTYKRFSKIVKEFRRFYKLTEFSLREIDHYFWIGGKEYFSKKRY